MLGTITYKDDSYRYVVARSDIEQGGFGALGKGKPNADRYVGCRGESLILWAWALGYNDFNNLVMHTRVQ